MIKLIACNQHHKVFHLFKSPHAYKPSVQRFLHDFSTATSTNQTLHALVNNRKNKPLNLWQRQGLVKPAPTELLLLQTLIEIFPEHRPKYKVKKEANVINPKTNHPLEVDVWFPTLGLYFEYQDPHHYQTMWYCHTPLGDIQELDHIKKQIVTQRGETLIQVPCWWDGQKESLAATIKAQRPDLLPHMNVSCGPIAAESPPNFFKNSAVSNVGELMVASFFSESKLSQALSSNAWWMQEKYDGYRCCWDPVSATFFSRAGHPLTIIPDAFKSQMPPEYLDGEIWFGYGSFQEAAKLNPRNKTSNIDWQSFRFIVFDVPSPKYISEQTPYEERYQRLIEVVNPSHPFIKVEAKHHIKDKAHLMEFVNEVIQKGGEGVIIRQNGSPYVSGRSEFLGKLKIMRDEDALISDVDYRTSRYTLELPHGTTFIVPIPEAEEFSGSLPNKGDVVSFTFKHFVNGNLPSDPQIQRIRNDLNWDEVKANNSKRYYLNVHKDYTRRWAGDKESVRQHFEQFAKDNGFDPLVPANWYKINPKAIRATPGSSNMLRVHYKGSIVKALLDQFPEIGFDIFKFKTLPKNFLADKENMRAFVIRLAKNHGFDPFVAENWYKFRFSTKKERLAILNGKSFSSILAEALPEVIFNKARFKSPKHFYSRKENVRELMIQIAKENEFDPFLPENWYTFPFSTMKQWATICKHGESFPIKLAEAFPELQFDMTRFNTSRNFYTQPENVRALLIRLASEHRFDPFMADNWYRFPFSIVKQCQTICKDSSFPIKVAEAFPEVKFDMTRFKPRKDFREQRS